MALCQVTSFSQSECFISAKCSHVMTNFLWHRLLERGPNKTEDQSAATHVSRIAHIPEFNCWKWNVFLTGDLIKKLTGLKFFGKMSRVSVSFKNSLELMFADGILCSTFRETENRWIKNQIGQRSGCGSVGNVFASVTRGLHFESRHRQIGRARKREIQLERKRETENER